MIAEKLHPTDAYRADNLAVLLEHYLPVLSHDVRTPMTAIRGATGLLSSGLAGRLSDHQQKLVDICHRNADLTTLLVQDVVDLLRLHSGVLKTHPVELDAFAEANEYWEMVKSQTALHTEITGADGAAILTADRNYLRRSISALIRFPQGFPGVERVSLRVRSLEGGIELALRAAPLALDIEPLMRTIVRGRRQTPDRLSVTGLELDLLQSMAMFFSGSFEATLMGDDIVQMSLYWPGNPL